MCPILATIAYRRVLRNKRGTTKTFVVGTWVVREGWVMHVEDLRSCK